MNKKIVIASYDDMWEGNDHWEIFVNFQKKHPSFKVTFFVNPGVCSDEFMKKINQPWTELAYHCENHSGGYKQWTKEEAKEYLLKYHNEYGFVKGFKAPGWKITQNIIDACKELDFWIASTMTVPVDIERKYYTHHVKDEGLSHHEDHSQFYGHLQSYNFDENLKELGQHCEVYDPEFKFISKIIT